MSASIEIKDLKTTIFELLRDYPKYRDSDKKLCSRIWAIELQESGIDIRTLTTYDFFDIYSNQQILSTADSVTRVSRLVKKEHPEYEGTKENRLPECENVKEEIKKPL